MDNLAPMHDAPANPQKVRKATHTKTGTALRLNNDLFDALDAFVAAQTFPPTRTQIIEAALKAFLEKEGFYPPRP